ncbi:MAG: hypothetical protein LBH39_00835 [Clostridiales Family XIII bacterium]|jgi:hypothetical protein|nr:hypothetical protein [Clostridiales Family XIII bacterium]
MGGGLTKESYLARKEGILNRCLALTQDFYNSIERPEALESLLGQRMEAIEELAELEQALGSGADLAISKCEFDRLNNKLSLVLDLDNKASAALAEARDKLLESMKSNTAERRLLQYSPAEPEMGRLMDQKE